MKGFVKIVMVVVATWISFPVLADEEYEVEEIEEIEIYLGYLEIAHQFLSLATQSEAAIFLAIEDIVEIYEERDDFLGAVEELENILMQYPDNQAVRNIVHLKLRDLYRGEEQPDEALRQLRQLIRENQ